MKNILKIFTGTIWFWLSTGAVLAQDTTPRGPAQWTAGNWLGFCIQIGLFVLVVFGIYRLALGGGGEDGDIKSETPGVNSRTQNPAVGASDDKMNAL